MSHASIYIKYIQSEKPIKPILDKTREDLQNSSLNLNGNSADLESLNYSNEVEQSLIDETNFLALLGDMSLDQILGTDLDIEIRGKITCDDLKEQGIESQFVIYNNILYLLIGNTVLKHTYTVINPVGNIRKVWEPVHPNVFSIFHREMGYSTLSLFPSPNHRSASFSHTRRSIYGRVLGCVNGIDIVMGR